MPAPATLVSLDLADDPLPWAAAGFAVADDLVVLGGLPLRCTAASDRRGVTGWGLDPPFGPGLVPPFGPGLAALGVAAPPTGATPTAAHPNTAVALDHVVVATRDLEGTTDALADVGWTPRRTTPDPRGGQRTMRFFLLPTPGGRVVLELIGDRDGPSQPTTWGLAVAVADLDAACRLLGPDRVGAPRPAVQPGRRIATVRHHAAGITIPLALMSARVVEGSPDG